LSGRIRFVIKLSDKIEQKVIFERPDPDLGKTVHDLQVYVSGLQQIYLKLTKFMRQSGVGLDGSRSSL
jgi:hypothetical protein